jgi:hypothetical protein
MGKVQPMVGCRVGAQGSHQRMPELPGRWGLGCRSLGMYVCACVYVYDQYSTSGSLASGSRCTAILCPLLLCLLLLGALLMYLGPAGPGMEMGPLDAPEVREASTPGRWWVSGAGAGPGGGDYMPRPDACREVATYIQGW